MDNGTNPFLHSSARGALEVKRLHESVDKRIMQSSNAARRRQPAAIDRYTGPARAATNTASQREAKTK